MLVCVEGKPQDIPTRKKQSVNAKQAMEQDRKYGLVRVLPKHREEAWNIIHDSNGKQVMNSIIVEVLATLIAKAYPESEAL